MSKYQLRRTQEKQCAGHVTGAWSLLKTFPYALNIWVSDAGWIFEFVCITCHHLLSDSIPRLRLAVQWLFAGCWLLTEESNQIGWITNQPFNLHLCTCWCSFHCWPWRPPHFKNMWVFVSSVFFKKIRKQDYGLRIYVQHSQKTHWYLDAAAKVNLPWKKQWIVCDQAIHRFCCRRSVKNVRSLWGSDCNQNSLSFVLIP